MRKVWIILLLSGLILLLISCKNDLIDMEESILKRAADDTAPKLELLSPLSDSIYDQSITIRGTVWDDGTALPTVTYTLKDNLGIDPLSGSVQIEADDNSTEGSGTFLFNLPTSQFESDIVLTLVATDWNGNSSEAIEVKLEYPGSTLPSLTVSPGNKQVSLIWEPIENATEYIIYYNSEGTDFAESVADTIILNAADFDETSPVILENSNNNVMNGVLCQIRVTASDRDGNTWSSPLLKTVPLSQFSLIPKTESYEDEIYLTWKAIKVPDQEFVTYKVWRSSNGKEGTYSLISNELLRNPNYTDKSVSPGIQYYYKISVEENEQQYSSPHAAQCSMMYKELSAEIKRFFNGDVIVQIEVDGDTAYAIRKIYNDTDWIDVELIALDISDLTNISILSSDRGDLDSLIGNHNIFTYDMTISDERAYVGAKYNDDVGTNHYEILSFDISDKDNVRVKTSEKIINGTYEPRALEADPIRKILYIGYSYSDNSYLATVNITTPSNTGTEAINMGSPVSHDARDVGFIDNYAYLLSGYYSPESAELTPYNCSVINSPKKGTSINLDSAAFSNDECLDVQALDIDPLTEKMVIVSMVNDDLIDSNYYHGGIWTFDISTHSTPVFEGGIDTGIPLMDVKIGDSYAYCTANNGKVKVMGISDPSLIFERAKYDTIGSSLALGINSSGIIVADESAGITTILLGDAESMTIIDQSTVNQSNNSFLSGDKVYVAQRYGVSAFDLENNGDITSLNYQSMYSEDVVVLGEYAFYATGSNTSGELAAIKLSDNGDVSNSPIYYSGEYNSYGIDYWGDYLYVAESDAGVEVFDISDPENLISLGLIPVERDAKKVLALDDYLYIADDIWGMQCYEISNPEDPDYIGDFYDSDSSERSIYTISASKDQIIYSADTGTYILNARPVSDWNEASSSSSQRGSALSFIESITSWGANAEGNFLYTSETGNSGVIRIYSLEDPENPQLVYISDPYFMSGTLDNIELYGNFMVAQTSTKLYTIQINQ